MPDPMPNLRPGNFRRGGILHQMVNRSGSGSFEPSLQILHGHPDVFPESIFRDHAFRHGEQIFRLDLDILSSCEFGFGLSCIGQKFLRHRNQTGMCHPGPVMAVFGFSLYRNGLFSWLPHWLFRPV